MGKWYVVEVKMWVRQPITYDMYSGDIRYVQDKEMANEAQERLIKYSKLHPKDIRIREIETDDLYV